ncbi:ATP synthase subunit I [Chitiniphilus purpureus]|uniref:ATP synthase subunit I n=1 Tax=Chitiniphilus purpureus TaxID=2981137 RepID=A0ABY6DN39_9NEIS|nr:ATP synthase subunit I [Chitiniphilus sp. CD1]UXY15779.1 ATP synthase subunit I [Chitiniphilus sp. CD1]
MVKRPEIRRVIRLKLVLTIAVSVLAYLLWGASAGFSSLLGGTISLAGALIYARIAYRGGWQAPTAMLSRHYAAEMAKFGWTITGFALVILLIPVHGLGLLLGYIAATAAYWLGLFVKLEKN